MFERGLGILVVVFLPADSCQKGNFQKGLRLATTLLLLQDVVMAKGFHGYVLKTEGKA